MGEQLLLSCNTQKKSCTGHSLEDKQAWHLVSTKYFLIFFFFWCRPFLKSLLNLLQYCFCLIYLFGHEVCGILAPQPGIEPAPPALEGEVSSWFLKKKKNCPLDCIHLKALPFKEALYCILWNHQLMFMSPLTKSWVPWGKDPHFIQLWIPYPSTVSSTTEAPNKCVWDKWVNGNEQSPWDRLCTGSWRPAV